MVVRLRKNRRINLDGMTKVALLCFLVAYLVFAMMLPADPTGESGSFSLLTVSLVESGDFVISETDYEKAVELFPTHEYYLNWYYHDFIPQDDQGLRYPWYFGAYAFLCVPAFLALCLFKMQPIYAFAITNALLLAGALYVVYRKCKLSEMQRLVLILLLGFSPIIRYIQWQSYEVATGAFVICAMVYWFQGSRYMAALLLSIAGTMNPTAMGFGIFMILEYFFERFQQDQYHFAAFVRRSLADWKEIGLYALCFVPCLIPMGITYAVFSRFNAVAMTGVTDYSGVGTRLLVYLFDLNLGILPYAPILLILLVVVTGAAIVKKNWKYVFAFLGIMATMAAYSITYHINCGMMGIARYNAWLLPVMIIMVFYGINSGLLHARAQKIARLAATISVAWCVFAVGLVAYWPNNGGAQYWTAFAELAMEYVPALYDPLPSTFRSRTDHIDGGYEILEPVVYCNEDGYVRKILVPAGVPLDCLDNLVVDDADMAAYEREYEKLSDNESHCYLNFPHGTKIQYAEQYTLGEQIQFTPTNDGTRYFINGISWSEGDFAWSDGTQSHLKMSVGNVKGDINAVLGFKMIYGEKQTLSVSCKGQELFYGEVTPDQHQVSFDIPKDLLEGDVLYLTFEYPDAVNLAAIGNGDNRTVAFAWNQMEFTSQGE